MTPIILPRHTQGYCVKDRVEWVVAVVMGAEVGGGGEVGKVWKVPSLIRSPPSQEAKRP